MATKPPGQTHNQPGGSGRPQGSNAPPGVFVGADINRSGTQRLVSFGQRPSTRPNNPQRQRHTLKSRVQALSHATFGCPQRASAAPTAATNVACSLFRLRHRRAPSHKSNCIGMSVGRILGRCRKMASLPITPGSPERRTDDNVRHGTTNWFFANRYADNGGVLDVVTDRAATELWNDTDF